MVKIKDIFCFDFDFQWEVPKLLYHVFSLWLWKYGKHQINKSNQNKQTNKQVNTFLKQHSSIIISLHQNQDKSIKHVVKMENGMGSPLAVKKLNVGKCPGWPMEKSMFWMDVPIGVPELSTSAKMTTASWVGNPKGPGWNRVGREQLLNVSIPSVLNWKLWKMQMWQLLVIDRIT